MFNIGFRSYITEHDLQVAKELDMKVLEVMFEDSNRHKTDEIAGLLKEYDIKPAALAIFPQRGIDELKSDVEFAKRIDCNVYVAHPAPLTFKEHENIKKFKEFWKEACKCGADNGVHIAVQSCGLNPESWDIMFHEVPELCLKYDPSFSNQEGRDIPGELLRYGKRIVHTHAKDEIPVRRHCYKNSIDYVYAPPGMGSINWGSFIALLYQVGYKHSIAIEVHSDFWFSKEYFKGGLLLAKRHLEQFMF